MELNRIKAESTTQLKSHLESSEKPVIITNLFSDWPCISLAKESPLKFLRSLMSQANNVNVDTLLIRKEHNGIIGYSDESFNNHTFTKYEVPLQSVLKRLTIDYNKVDIDRVAIQSALLSECLPNFSTLNPSPDFLESITPRIWLGNETTVPGHYDTEHNIALNLCGKRTFYLLPTHVISSLYLAPIDRAITGPAISLVDFENPDLDKFPKFKSVQNQIVTANLQAGEALYIPPLWWHNVKAKDKFNMLVNYWWKDDFLLKNTTQQPSDSLLHTLLTIRNLPKQQKSGWQSIFNYYIFNNDENTYEKNNYNGILSASKDDIKDIEEVIIKRINKQKCR